MSAVGDVLRATEEESPERQAELARTADAAVNELTGAWLGGEPHSHDAPSAVESILLSLHRMLRVVKTWPAGRGTGGPVRNPLRNLGSPTAHPTAHPATVTPQPVPPSAGVARLVQRRDRTAEVPASGQRVPRHVVGALPAAALGPGLC